MRKKLTRFSAVLLAVLVFGAADAQAQMATVVTLQDSVLGDRSSASAAIEAATLITARRWLSA
jgi:hypothetical protein